MNNEPIDIDIEKAASGHSNLKKLAAKYFETCPDGHMIWSEWLHDKKNNKD